MVQSGGWIVSEDGKQATGRQRRRTSPRWPTCRRCSSTGSLPYPKALDAGWGGEAFGKGKAAMTIEGNWIKGAMTNDFPNVKYTVHELPAGPTGKGTLSFTNCWGIAAKSKFKEQAIDFVKAMTTVDQQMTYAKAFGVMPSRQSARDQYTAAVPGRPGVHRRRRVRAGPGERPEDGQRPGRLRRLAATRCRPATRRRCSGPAEEHPGDLGG